MREARRAVLVGISTIAWGGQAWAEPVRLQERVVPACAVAARELRPKLERALAGSLPDELEASVAIEASGAGYRASIGLRGAVAQGATVIEAPTCDEAVDAAAVVLALAFANRDRTKPDDALPAAHSVPATEPSPATPSERSRVSPSFGSFVEPAPTPPSERPAWHGSGGVPTDRGAPSNADRATRIGLASGVDGGTLPQPTLVLAGAITRQVVGIELAAIARYGLPITEERVESDFSASQRHDFGEVELRACHGAGQAIRLAACAGTEVGAVRGRRAREGQDRADHQSSLAPRLSGTLAALVAHRGGFVEPGLELGAAAVAMGRDAEAPWLVVRVAAGAAIAF